MERTVRCAVIPRVGESLPDMKPEEVTEHNREEGWKKQELSRIQMSLLLAHFNLSILKVENAERMESFFLSSQLTTTITKSKKNISLLALLISNN